MTQPTQSDEPPRLPPLPCRLRFADVDPAELARAEPPPRPASAPPPQNGAWSAYLARMLPPLQPDAPQDAGTPALLRTEAGMADFLLSLGPAPARDLAQGLGALDRSGFWGAVQRQVETLAAR